MRRIGFADAQDTGYPLIYVKIYNHISILTNKAQPRNAVDDSACRRVADHADADAALMPTDTPKPLARPADTMGTIDPKY